MKTLRTLALLLAVALSWIGTEAKSPRTKKLIPPPHGPVTAVPDSLRPLIDRYYQKYIESEGLYIVASERVSNEALEIASDIVGYMLLKRPDVKRHMVRRGNRLMIIGKDENTCDIPEFKFFCTEDSATVAYWNWRSRGFGGSPDNGDITASCGEENLLALPSDRYKGENILIHEFAHLIHQFGIAEVEPDFNDRLEALYQKAKRNGLWANTYAMTNKEEYFAEMVQSFYNCNRYSEKPDGVHCSVNRRHKLKEYDPEGYALVAQYLPLIDIPIRNTVHE